MTIASSSRITLDHAPAPRPPRPRPAEPPLPKLSIARSYAWADRPHNAVLVSCRDVARMPLASQQGGLDVYLHRNRPCKHAIVVGTVVGVTDKEAVARYMIDDGTSVLEVLYRGHANAAPAQRRARIDRRAPMPNDAPSIYDPGYAGIPPQYLPPPPKPQPPPKSIAQGPTPSPLMPGCDVGTLVRAAGRITLDWDGRRRLLVDAGGGEPNKVEGSLDILTDPNEELRHILERIRLAKESYSQPFHLPPEPVPAPRALRIIPDSSADATPKARAPGQLSAATLRAIRQLRGQDVGSGSSTSHDASTHDSTQCKRASPSPEPKPSRRPKVRRSLPMDDAPVAPGAQRQASSLYQASSSRTRAPSRATAHPPASRQPSLSSPSSVTSRKLRHHSKLTDDRISDDLFRLHMQRWVVEHCGAPTIAAEQLEMESQRLPAPPPLFTLAYLLRVPDLTALGRRLIGLKLQRRERKRAAERARNASASTVATPTASSEPLSLKLERLFGWAVRQMVHDGLVALGPCDAVAHPPFDGRRPEEVGLPGSDEDGEAPPSSGSYSGVYQRSQTARRPRPRSSTLPSTQSQLCTALREAQLLEWSDQDDSDTDESSTESEMDSLQGTPTQARPLALASSRARGREDKAKSTPKATSPVMECYQLVHPSSLAPDLRAMLDSLPADAEQPLDAATALERLRRRDERWRFVAESAVRQGLEWLMEEAR